jgi:DNA-binding NtrC family response regulator
MSPTKSGGSVLLVEDEVPVAQELAGILRASGYQVISAYSKKQGIEKLRNETVDLILLDLGLPDGDGLDILRFANEQHISATTLILSNLGTVPRAVEAMRLGAEDFLEKPVSEPHLLLAVRNALERRRLLREVDNLRGNMEDLRSQMAAEGLPGISRAIQNVRRFILRTAAEDLPVLITGERGTGKTRAARLFHRLSGRNGPFVEVACPHLPHDIFEAELFGSVPGAFTGAVDKPGLIEEAASGTLFLDEVSEMRPDTQAKFLQVLSEGGTYRRIGDTQERRLRARVIAATNRDLEEAVRDGLFRPDLLLRLGTLRLHMPPLRERREDIPFLARYFIERSCRRRGVPLLRLTPEAEAALCDHDWPGNVAELLAVAERIRIFATDQRVTHRDVTEAIRLGQAPETPAVPERLSLREALRRFERSYILEALERHEGSIGRTAETLGIDRTTLWRKLKEYGLSTRPDEG